MSYAQALVRSLFTAPGQVVCGRDALLGRAAAAHTNLLSRTLAGAGPDLACTLAPIGEYLLGSASSKTKCQLLCHPLFVEGLHALAPFSSDLQKWHACVTACPSNAPVNPAAIDSLGNVALAVLLQTDRSRCGQSHLCTDVLGRLGFPFCDWTFLLYSEDGAPLAGRSVSLTLDHDLACWRIDKEREPPFLVMPRAACMRMLVDNEAEIDGRAMQFPNPNVRLQLTCACRIGRSSVRFDPVGIPYRSNHAGVTGGLIARIVSAIRRDSPAVYQEFRTYIRTIRGFEFPRTASVASFSDPTLPGVMGMSVAFSERDEPCLDPFCFTWFGHEMGHTKDYLCDTILFSQGESLVTNGCERSDIIPRYGRPLAVRTLIQVPYVHLYEWALLMDFCAADFHGLPWRIAGGADVIGDDYAAEIEESFELIDRWAEMTPIGVAAVDHFHELFDAANERWQLLRTLA